MEPRHLSRLQEEQMKAISETTVKMEQLEQFKQDYKCLQDRLRTLPDKLTHDVMVPFGKLAFMPGRLTHTNEILVLLGDNWFVERSAKQAVDIINRRIQELDSKLTDLKAQQKLLQPRLDFTSDLQAQMEGRGDIQEIIEEYDESKEKLWDEQHRKNVKKYKEEIKINSESQNSLERREDTQGSQERKSDRQKTDEYLWSRLDELERQEFRRGELRNMSAGEDEESEDQEQSPVKAGSNHPSLAERRVSWADLVKEEKVLQQELDDSSGEHTEDDDTDNEADNDGDDETTTPKKPVGKTITFTHSPTPFILPHQVSEGGDVTIHSPADIYKLYCPKSILKKTADSESVLDDNEKTESSVSNRPSVDMNKQAPHDGRSYTSHNEQQNVGLANSQSTISSMSATNKAFTGFVIEVSDLSPAATSTTETSSSCATSATAASTTQPPARRVSKFKASRQPHTTN
ncbi:hypothetical protein BsWGS_16493 [Bradybaena similaris]